MTPHEVTLVRIYLREAENLLDKLLNYLHDDAKVMGVTVVRGIEGFGEDGKIRAVSLLNLSMDLPLVVEFYDKPDKAKNVIETLVDEMRLPHVISLPAIGYQYETGKSNSIIDTL
ncbi:DUF190 domain-containing protein [Methylomonas rapida]|uniref:DUF190 domain-containing protein n=1 Tax=Methylomonas rapida TaxID=2963939 RepID=A0ABY7GQD3_9GAMM|nr:DUF190 domain-containing protein [Methylomonas rapida]WAR46711.1 DUF190 domain-containing protein [Methylomonas rapida]